MPTVNRSTRSAPQPSVAEWLSQLNQLVDEVESWAREIDWSTRRIEKEIDEGEFGRYGAPALVMQHNFTRVLLEPISHRVAGADGLVDLYAMPAYDDLAALYLSKGKWKIRYQFEKRTGIAAQDEATKALNRRTFQQALQAIEQHAAQ